VLVAGLMMMFCGMDPMSTWRGRAAQPLVCPARQCDPFRPFAFGQSIDRLLAAIRRYVPF